MAIQIRKAQRYKSKLRLGLAGPSGSGKTMSALKLAKGLVGPNGKVVLIDTERGSGDLYANLFDYDIIDIQPPYKPDKYVEAIKAAEEAGYEVIIIDSLSHAWSDEGGLLDQADKLSQGGNRFQTWANLTPQHRQLVNGMLGANAHIIGTVRSKQEYAMEKDEKTGRTSVKKMGMAPVQREGMEYEFTVFMDIEMNHYAKSSKDRTNLFKDEVFLIDESIGVRLIDWLNTGTESPDTVIVTKRKIIKALLAQIDMRPETLPAAIATVKSLTQITMADDNLDEVIQALQNRINGAKEESEKAPTAPEAPKAPINDGGAKMTQEVKEEPKQVPNNAPVDENGKGEDWDAVFGVKQEPNLNE